jgi:hypothetical protein
VNQGGKSCFFKTKIFKECLFFFGIFYTAKIGFEFAADADRFRTFVFCSCFYGINVRIAMTYSFFINIANIKYGFCRDKMTVVNCRFFFVA